MATPRTDWPTIGSHWKLEGEIWRVSCVWKNQREHGPVLITLHHEFNVTRTVSRDLFLRKAILVDDKPRRAFGPG